MVVDVEEDQGRGDDLPDAPVLEPHSRVERQIRSDGTFSASPGSVTESVAKWSMTFAWMTGRYGVGDGFLVEVAGLGRLITTLSEAADRMRAANDRLRAASAADLGSVGLDRAAGAFQDRWEYGIGKISDASDKMTESLREAKQLYEQTDQAIATLFPDPGGPAAQPGGPGSTADGAGPATPETSSPISQALDGGSVR